MRDSNFLYNAITGRMMLVHSLIIGVVLYMPKWLFDILQNGKNGTCNGF